MESIGTVYSYTPNPRVMKIQAAAALNDRTVDIATEFSMGTTNKTVQFLADFPLGQVPAFRGRNGLVLSESDAIAQYAAEEGPARDRLLGSSAEERATIRQWIGFADHNLFVPLQNLVLWRYGMAPYEEKLEATAFAALEKSLLVLEGRLSIAAAMYWGFSQIVDKEMREQYPLIVEWYLRVIKQEKVRAAFGEEQFIELRKEGPP